MAATINVLQDGDTSKSNPFTIAIIANPAIERFGSFVQDPIIGKQAEFVAYADHIVDCLFGRLAGQAEKFLADPSIEPRIRIFSLYDPDLPVDSAHSLISEEADLLVPRRDLFQAFLSSYDLQSDISYAVSQSTVNKRAAAFSATDDDARPGVPFTLNGTTFHHRHFDLIPGSIGIHTTSASVTPLHEFGHASSSYNNGEIADLYVDNRDTLNNRRGRPIPPDFAVYNSVTYLSDRNRGGRGYPADWASYHCELHDTGVPALMDDYWVGNSPERCQHDKITRQFLRDRILARLAR